MPAQKQDKTLTNNDNIEKRGKKSVNVENANLDSNLNSLKKEKEIGVDNLNNSNVKKSNAKSENAKNKIIDNKTIDNKSSNTKSSKLKNEQTKEKDNELTEKTNSSNALVEICDENETTKVKDSKTKTTSKMKKFWNVVSWVLVSVVCALILAIVIMLIVGFKPAVVLTPSMTPNIMPGDLIVFKATDPENINEGDVITFWASAESQEENGTSVTHRVVKKHNDGDGTFSFTTKGDYNDTNDSQPVPQERVIGKVYIVLPWIGQLFLFIKNNLLVIVFSVISIVILYYLISMFIKNKKNNDGVEETANKIDVK